MQSFPFFFVQYSINSANWRRRDFGRRDIISSCSISVLIRFRLCRASRPCSTWLYTLASELMAGGKPPTGGSPVDLVYFHAEDRCNAVSDIQKTRITNYFDFTRARF